MTDITDQERQEQLKAGKPAVPGGLASVGGGTIPGGSVTQDKSDNATDSVPQESNSAGDGEHSERERSISAARNEITQSTSVEGQGNLGGRNPGQSQNQPLGDQDATFSDRGKELTDPMTSRAPDKNNK